MGVNVHAYARDTFYSKQGGKGNCLVVFVAANIFSILTVLADEGDGVRGGSFSEVGCMYASGARSSHAIRSST